MNCPGMEDVMAWIDSELPADRMESFRAHLGQCTTCRKLIEHQELIEKTWRESYTPPSDFEFIQFEKQLTGRLFRSRNWIRTALPVAAAFAAVLLGIRIFVIGTPPATVLERLEETPAAILEPGIQADGYGDLSGEIVRDEAVLATSEDSGEYADHAVSEESPGGVPLTGGGMTEETCDTENLFSISTAGSGELSAGGEDGLIDHGYSAQTAESEAAVGQTVSEPADDQLGYGGDTDGMGMILSHAEQMSFNQEQAAANRSMHQDGITASAEEQETEEVIATGTAEGGSGGCAFEEQSIAELPQPVMEGESTEADGWESLYYGYNPEDPGETASGTVETASCFGASVISGGAPSVEDTCPESASDESVVDTSIVLALREDRRSRNNMDSTLLVLEQDILLDWNEKSAPEEILLPTCISVSFRIAPDGSVFDIDVAVPPDSFFFDFVAEIESRISSLYFEDTADDACIDVELDMVLY